jgi:hypothetical protein
VLTGAAPLFVVDVLLGPGVVPGFGVGPGVVPGFGVGLGPGVGDVGQLAELGQLQPSVMHMRSTVTLGRASWAAHCAATVVPPGLSHPYRSRMPLVSCMTDP